MTLIQRSNTDPSSDEELVALLLQGHQAALGILWDRYAHLVFGVAMKYLKDIEQSKDAVADLFATLPALLKKHEVQRFRPWLHTVMRNRCLMLLRSARNGHDRTADLIADTAIGSSDDAVLRECTLQQLEIAITELNEAQRTCIDMFYLQQHTYQHVATHTGLSIENVRSHLQNGRRNLRLILERAGISRARPHA